MFANKNRSPSRDQQAHPADTSSETAVAHTTDSPKTALPAELTITTSDDRDDNQASHNDADSTLENSDGNTDGNTSRQDSIDIPELGKQSLDEASFRYWVGRLRNNPQLLQAAVNEYLENTDPTRSRNLAALLAEVNSPLVLNAATQLTQSPDTTTQLIGLELIARLQPTNTHARNHAIDMLATQTDPTLLVATLNVFATPAQAVSGEQRQLILDHARLLTTHSDANVRALGIDTISRWSKGNSGGAATIGLNDPDSAVRAKSAASLIGVKNPSAESRQNLLLVAANKQEVKTTRQLALYALSKMPLTETERQRYEALEIEVRRTP